MAYTAEKFLNEQDREKIDNAVKEAERDTSGEIIPMVVSGSYHYPMSNVLGGIVFAFPLSLVLTYFLGGWLWIGHYNLWLFLGIIILLFILFYQMVKHTPNLKRFFISDKEIDEEIEEAAITAFFREGLYRTRDETGVLIFISVFEHRVQVLADRGINAKVKEGEWDAIVKMITEGIKNKNQAEAICKAIGEAGRILKEYFPRRADDKDELKNLIVEGE
ncbi:MAG: TPM domain-containing protein [Deltaproteobacteria bacterium]|nr:TPM domain-containing protein [Deltaproteobacteria bacterium]